MAGSSRRSRPMLEAPPPERRSRCLAAPNLSSAGVSFADLPILSSSCSTSVSADSGYQKYRTLTMPVSEPSSTLAEIVWPDASVLESAGSTILNAYAWRWKA